MDGGSIPPSSTIVMSRDIRKTRTPIRVRVSCFSVLRAWLGNDEFGATDDAVDGRSGDGDLVVVLKVPGDRVGAGVEAVMGEGSAELEHQLDGCGGCFAWSCAWAPRARLERAVAFGVVAGHEARDPCFRCPVVPCDLGL